MRAADQNRLRDRRLFLRGVAAVAATAAGTRWTAAARPHRRVANDTVRVGVMGVNGRGAALSSGFMAAGGAEVGAVCDVDSRALERVAKRVVEGQDRAPKLTADFRTMLDDPEIDALVIAAPNHWHAPAAILACAAGKHVYVEKPCSHNPQEGEWAVQAARKHDRVVQMGTQRRSWPAIREAISKVQEGALGRVLYARTWYNNRRGPVGVGKPAPVPEWLDWEMWQGPAPRTPYRDNIVHYRWHWHWPWGNGELGNNGVHAIDVARWGLQVTYPTYVSAGGGKYRHEDDQTTPDTMMTTFDFPEDKTITWEGLSWSPLGVHDSRFGISFHGTEASIVITGAGYAVFDMQGEQRETFSGPGGDGSHLENFLAAIRESKRPHADILEAHRSTLLCHLGNIAYRTRSVLRTDPANGHILDQPQAAAMWQREYAEGWEAQLTAAATG
jgi:predicted dehydrogenase